MGSTFAAGVLTRLMQQKRQVAAIDFARSGDLRRLLNLPDRLDPPTILWSAQAAAASERGLDADEVDLLLQNVTAGLVIADTPSRHVRSRHQLEDASIVRVLVSEPTGRGVQETSRWLAHSPPMPTLLLANALPGISGGRHYQESAKRLSGLQNDQIRFAAMRRTASAVEDPSAPAGPLTRLRGRKILQDCLAAAELLQELLDGAALAP